SGCSRVPCAMTSTLPSELLRTQPLIPRMWASRSTNQRKPTPCTRPRIVAGFCNFEDLERVGCWLPCEEGEERAGHGFCCSGRESLRRFGLRILPGFLSGKSVRE